MKRMLLAATLLAATRIALVPAGPAMAQNADQSAAPAGSDGTPSAGHRHHRRHHHAAAALAAPSVDAAPAAVAQAAAEPAPSHALTPIAAMATVRLPDTGTQVVGAGEGLTPLGAPYAPATKTAAYPPGPAAWSAAPPSVSARRAFRPIRFPKSGRCSRSPRRTSTATPTSLPPERWR